MKDRIREQLKKILLTEMGMELNFDVANYLQNFDSLDFVEFIMYVERDFKVTVTNQQMYELKRMEDLVELLVSKLP